MYFRKIIFALVLFIGASKAAFAQFDLTVAADGSGNYTTVQAAINAVPGGQTTPYRILIKNGKYREKINIPSSKTFVQLVGESVANTIVYFDDASANAGGTSASASFTVNANDFSAFNITFANTYDYDAGVAAGVTNTQGVAVLVNGDRAAFKNCRFLGNQDTLYQNKKGYYKNCYVDGIIDFIFGGGAVVFDSCTIYPKTRTVGGSSYITAANTPAGQPYGYLFRDCKFISNPGGTMYVLGRSWQNSTGAAMPFAENKVVLANSILNANISPAGWAVWDAGTNTSLITFAEHQSKYFNNNPVDVSSRVSWSQQFNSSQIAAYTNANILSGWDPCAIYPGICNAAPAEIAVSNFSGTKGVGLCTFKWNLSWGMSTVKFELFRSLIRNGSYSKIGEISSPNDTTYNFNLVDNSLPPGQQVFYYLLATKAGAASHITDTLLISTKPTINVTSALGTFQQGGGNPSASQTYSVNGVNLSDNIIVTPPANFEISTNNTSWIGSAGSVTLAPGGNGVLANTTIYVRQNASVAPGTFTGNITHSTLNGDNAEVPVTGTSQILPLTPAAFFRSRANGLLSDPATWETSADSITWFAASSYPAGAAEENITIMPGTSVTINAAHIVNGKWTVYGTGSNTGGAFTIGAAPGALSFSNNSKLIWNRDGGTLPAGTIFNAGSAFYLIGTGNGTAAGVSQLPTISASQVFHHVIINAPNIKTNNPNFGGNLNTINGNLLVLSTGVYNAKVRLANGAAQQINIGGDLIIDPPVANHVTFVLYSTTTNATTEAVNIGGSLTINNSFATNITGTNGTYTAGSTAVTLSSANPSILAGMGITGAGIATGTFVVSVSGTSVVLSAVTSAAGTDAALTFIRATASLNLTDNSGTGSRTYIKGNVTFNNAIFANSGTGLGTVYINRADGIPQMYSRTAGTISTTATWIVSAGAVFDLGTSLLPGAAFILSPGATLRTGLPALFGAAGNLNTTARTLSSAANFVFNGASAQNTTGDFTGTSPLANTVANLTIINSANVTLGNPLTVSNSLTLTGGKLILGSNTISANYVTGSAASYAVTGGTGSLKINNVGGAATLFPVGPAVNAYNPVTLSNSGAVDNFSVRVAGGTLPPGIDISPRSDSSVNDTWHITEDITGGSNASVTLQWNVTDQNNLFRNNNAAVVHSNGTEIDYSGTYEGATSIGGGRFSATGTGFTTFSPFGVNSRPTGVVPMSLLTFNAFRERSSVRLNWRAENETNVTNYEVLRSADQFNFKKIGFVNASGITSNNEYNFTDQNPINGVGYYRLKIVEGTVSSHYSSVVRISSGTQKGLNIFPNPIKELLHIEHDKATPGASLAVYTADGRKMRTWHPETGAVQSKLNLGVNPGVYFLVYINNGTTTRSVLIKE